MANPVSISDAEWEVMRVLWGRGEALTANEIVGLLGGRRSWSPRTVKTLLNRLITKGALSFEARGKVYWYRAKATREECVRRESRSFLAKVFGGDEGAMLVHFVKHTKLSAEEIAELKRILNGKERP
jgi:BlaI family penicillinase repressor